MIKIIEKETAQELQDKCNEFNTHTPCFATQTHVTYRGEGIPTLYTAVLFYIEVKSKWLVKEK